VSRLNSRLEREYPSRELSVQGNGDSVTEVVVNFDREIFISQRYGGISNSFSKLIEQFLLNQNLGVKPNLSFTRSDNEHLQATLAKFEIRFKPQRKFLIANSGYRTGLTLGPIRAISSLWSGGVPTSNQSKIFHATYYRPNLIEKRIGQKLVCTVHDFIPEKLGWSGLRNPHIGKKSLISKADLVVCVSQATAQELQEQFGIPDDRVVVVHHGVDISNASVPKGLRIDSEPPKILYVGHRTGYKNFSTLLESLRIMRPRTDFKLVVAGPSLTTSEVDQLNKLVGESHWTVVESPTDDDLRRLYKEATVHCVTSTMEGFGMTILESMAQGTPAIVSSIEVFKEICGDLGIYFNPSNPEELATKLESVLNASIYKELSTSALLQASKFSWNDSATKLSLAYKRII